jgi:hypothetical protein
MDNSRSRSLCVLGDLSIREGDHGSRFIPVVGTKGLQPEILTHVGGVGSQRGDRRCGSRHAVKTKTGNTGSRHKPMQESKCVVESGVKRKEASRKENSRSRSRQVSG